MTPSPETPSKPRSAAASLRSAAALMVIATLGSRITGFARTIVITHIFGNTGEVNAFFQAFAIPDFVYFHHGVHVQHDIPCQRCHGPVEQMARPWRENAFTMDFCLDCHRHPPGLPDTGRALTSLTTCTACHR